MLKAAGGDPAAFEGLVERYQDRIFNLLVRLSGSDVEAEDLAQETFMKAYRALGSFRRGSKFYTWLFRIAVNTGYSRGRQAKRRLAREGVSLNAPGTSRSGAESHKASTLAEAVASTDPGPGERLERSEIQERVREGLARIKDEYRAVLLLRDMEGLDYEAIAETLSISRAAVKSRLHRARLLLARRLKDLRPKGREERRGD